MIGGALAHGGFAIMMLGIIASSAFSNPIGRNAGVQMGDSRDNFILERGQTRTINEYTVTYHGQSTSPDGHPSYQLTFVDPNGRSFNVDPVVYKSNSEQWIQHPDVTKFVEKDIFVAVSPNVMFDSDTGGDGQELTLSRGDSVRVGSDPAYGVAFVAYDMNVDHEAMEDSSEVAVGAIIDVVNLSTNETRRVRPLYRVTTDRSVQLDESTIEEWGLTIAFTGMNVDTGQIGVRVSGVESAVEDWVVVQAYEKPMIALVWIGFILLTIGFLIAIYRRIDEERFEHKRAVQA
jgi:cytochrome c-type biogenesis protein CcmF